MFQRQSALVVKNIAVVSISVMLAGLFFLMGVGGRALFAPFLTLYVFLALAEGAFVAGGETSKRETAMLCFAPILFVFSLLFLSLFTESLWLRLAMSLAVGAGNALYYTHLFFYLHVPSRYEPYALESAAWYFHLASLFSVSAGLFGIQLFTQVSPFVLIAVFALVASLIVYHVLWMAKVEPARAKLLAPLGSLMLTELFASCFFLPTTLYVNAATVTLAGYALFFIFRVNNKELHRLKTTHRVGFVAIGLFFLLALTAPWR